MFLKVCIKWYSLKDFIGTFFFNDMKDDGDLLNGLYGKSLINEKDVLPGVQIWQVLK